jgi:C4-type Zn-finger protein
MSLFRKTVDGILADVNKKIDQLQELAEQEQANARVSRALAQQAIHDAEAAELEADRALRISAKIEELVA